MRVNPEVARKAVNVISARYGTGVEIWLFGSRADDTQRGGGVDIFVQTDATDALRKLKCRSELIELFQLSVDLVVGLGDQPIHRIAKSKGVRLQ